jgi:hypothetical protein
MNWQQYESLLCDDCLSILNETNQIAQTECALSFVQNVKREQHPAAKAPEYLIEGSEGASAQDMPGIRGGQYQHKGDVTTWRVAEAA